jgi:signal transduction histidine kinase
MRSLLPLRSLTIKLGIVLFGLVFVVIAVLLLVVVPRLESRLVDDRLERLKEAVPLIEEKLPTWERHAVVYSAEAAPIGARYDTRVVIFQTLTQRSLQVFADSSFTRPPIALQRDPVAVTAHRTGAVESGRVERGGRPYAEVAFPVDGTVVLLTAPLSDVLRSFDLLRKSLLVAGGIALLAAAVLAYAAAWGLTRRLRRLEAAAEQIAAGDFGQPVVDRGRDEVAELAAAFENMRQRLAQLERARREFIQNASHELRTPLFSLGGFLELLEDEDLDEATRREFLVEIREQIERLTKLASDLLDLSRLDAGQLAVTAEDVDLSETARIVYEEFRPAADADGHRLDVHADGPIVAVADAQRVLQVARILVQNAIRHTPGGTPVKIAVAAGDGRAVLEVHDQGPGIPPEALPHVFERFYRAEGGRTSGSGLGLAIASELSRRMAGELTVRSRPGSTVFHLSLPRGRRGPISRKNALEANETEFASAGDSSRAEPWT